MAKKFLSDDEMNKLESAGKVEAPTKRVISDDEMNAMVANDKPILNTGLTGAAQSVYDAGKDFAGITSEVGHDFAVGAAEGLTLGGADEIGAVGATALEKLLGKIGIGPASAEGNIPVEDLPSLSPALKAKMKGKSVNIPEESLGDTYAGYQQASNKEFNAASERSPISNIAGNLGGSIVSGIALGGAAGINSASKAKPIMDIAKDSGKWNAAIEFAKRGGMNVLKASPLMAAESVMNSDNNLVGQNANPEAVLTDTVDNMAFGIPAMLGMQGISDVAAPMTKKAVTSATDGIGEWIDKSPLARKAVKAFEFGTQGINPVEEKAKKELLLGQTKKAQGLLNDIKAADKKLGQDVGNSLKLAEKNGQIINIDQPVMRALKELDYSYQNLHDMSSVSRGKQIFSRISDRMSKDGVGGDVTPTEAKDLLDDIDAFIGKFKASNNRTTPENNILETLTKTRKTLSDSMKDQIPEYRASAERFFDFRKNIPETILAGERPADVKNVFMGNLRETDTKLFDKLNNLAVESSGQGSGVENVIKAMGNTEQGMRQFELNEMARNNALLDAGGQANLNPLKMSSGQFSKTVRGYSDEAQMLRDMQTVKSPSVTGSNLIGQTFQMGKGGILTGANAAGRAAKPIANLSKKVYNMPAEKLGQYATKLQEIPGLKMYGKALQDGLQNGDQAKKNAALFSIMQNPSARIIFNDEDEE